MSRIPVKDIMAFKLNTNVELKCYKCGGSGKYYFRGEVLNGRFTGAVEDCYACKGKGITTKKDRWRNYFYHTGHKAT